jgi:chemosensory pili system protein ChpA (sensor histidine kinase/response regulator)
VLPSGAVVLIYNPVALAAVYGAQAKLLQQSGVAHSRSDGATESSAGLLKTSVAGMSQVPLVLVVDDSITVRRVTQRLLQREGYRVALAVDGVQALERLHTELPAVMLSDIEMPRMDGFELVRSVRSNPSWRDLPVITISSRMAEKHRQVAKEIGVNHYLGKPYGEEELLSLIRRYAKPTVASAA